MTTQYHFTFVNGGPDGIALLIRSDDGRWNGTLMTIRHVVRCLCIEVDEPQIPLFNHILDWVEGLTAEDVLAKATELLTARGYTGIQWVSEVSSKVDQPEGV